MPLRKPIAVFTATSSLEAHFLCGLLTQCGIEANVVEGYSHEGDMAPTIWIDQADVERAKPIFTDFEQRVVERRSAHFLPSGATSQESVLVTCEECGKESVFPAAQYGLIQRCSRCNAYVDVGAVGFDDWDVASDEY
jgi:hypothetical protein